MTAERDEDNTISGSNEVNNNILDNQDKGLQKQIIDQQLTQDFLTYAYAVITDRALPSIDGLKPVARKILYALFEEMGMNYGSKYTKSANIVGEVLGKYHPHGDQSIYGALVRIAQPWSLLHPLIDSQGNFGSIDGDEPASMRYTGVKVSKLFKYIFADLDKDTVEFIKNYDDTRTFPTLLPVRFPNLLLNGSIGIAVGMATSIPSHNLRELVEALMFMIDNDDANMNNPEEDNKSIFNFIKGPDFPTGGILFGKVGMMQGYRTGKGICKIRGKYSVNDREILITEIPYMTNKAKIIENIAESVKSKRIEGIAELRDESDDKIRIKIMVKKHFNPEIIMNQIFKYTALENSFSINSLVLVRGRPVLMSLFDMLQGFIDFREEVILRRSFYLLQVVRKKLLNLMVLNLVCENIDIIVRAVKKSKASQEAVEALCALTWPIKDFTLTIMQNINSSSKLNFYTDNSELLTKFNVENTEELTDFVNQESFHFSEKQAKFILDMRLSKLTSLERDKIKDDINKLFGDVEDLSSILVSRDRVMNVIKEELQELEGFYKERKTYISDLSVSIAEEELIVKEDRVVTITYDGYIKATSLNEYKTQNRGGKGRSGVEVKKMDKITNLFIGDTHTTILFFSNFGRVYAKKVYQLPKRNIVSRGLPLVNFIAISENEKITSTLVLPENINKDMYLIFATKFGKVRKSSLLDFAKIQSKGKIAIKLQLEDVLISVQLASNKDYVFLATKLGKAIKFNVNILRLCQSRDSLGVAGMVLQNDDIVKSLSILNINHSSIDINKKKTRQNNVDSGIEKVSYSGVATGDSGAEKEGGKIVANAKKGGQGCKEEDAINLYSDDQYQDFIEKYLTIPVNSRMRFKKDKSAMLKVNLLPQDILRQLVDNEVFILTITENGYGKKTSTYEYRVTSRGRSGILNANNLKKIGNIVDCLSVTSGNEIIVITNKGKTIRCNIDDIRSTGRMTSGVRICKLNDDEKIVSSELIMMDCLDELGVSSNTGVDVDSSSDKDGIDSKNIAENKDMTEDNNASKN